MFLFQTLLGICECLHRLSSSMDPIRATKAVVLKVLSLWSLFHMNLVVTQPACRIIVITSRFHFQSYQDDENVFTEQALDGFHVTKAIVLKVLFYIDFFHKASRYEFNGIQPTCNKIVITSCIMQFGYISLKTCCYSWIYRDCYIQNMIVIYFAIILS